MQEEWKMKRYDKEQEPQDVLCSYRRKGGVLETRRVTVALGEDYIVSPMNPQKQRHRGRVCMICGFIRTPYGGMAEVKFEDNMRCGRVDLGDLIPAEETV